MPMPYIFPIRFANFSDFINLVTKFSNRDYILNRICKFLCLVTKMVAVDLVFERFLGNGSFGTVSLFKYQSQRHGKTLYTAVKTSDDKHGDSLQKEFQILSELKGCSRIIQCYGEGVTKICDHKGNAKYKIHLEYAAEGSLSSFMDQFKDKQLPEPMIKKITGMLLQGLATIHKHGYVHCDLKPENILVFPSFVYKNGVKRRVYEIKICDFGLTKRDGDSKWWDPSKPYAGSPVYMSPESILHGEIGKGLDIWSLGCVVLEMFTGKKPWWHTNYDLTDLENYNEPLIPFDLPRDAKHFLMTCFAFKPEERKDALTLKRHSFLGREEKIDRSKETAMELQKIKQKISEIRMMGKD